MNGYERYKSKKWLSVSAMNNFCRCPRLYFYRQGCRLASPSKMAPLVFGGCIHKGLPYAFKGDIKKAMEAFCEDWDPDLNDDKRNMVRANGMFMNFYESHREGRSIYNPIPSPANRAKSEDHNGEYEVPFAVDIGLDVPLVGLVDCLARHRDTEDLVVVEYKTTSQLGGMFLGSFGLSPQVLVYMLAIKTLTGEEVELAFVEGLLVAKVSHNTAVIPIYVKDFQIKETLEWITTTYNKILACEEKENFPKDFSGCNSYSSFGMPGYTCPFAPLCSTTEDWQDLDDMYIVKEERLSPY